MSDESNDPGCARGSANWQSNIHDTDTGVFIESFVALA